MPDLITHTAVAYFILRPKIFARYRVIFYLGTILPDLISRPIYILFPKIVDYTIATHTPVFSLLVCLLLTQLFAQKIQRVVFLYLACGGALHFLLDILQRHLATGYTLLFPFSWKSFEIGLVWPEQTVTLIPFWIAAIIIFESIAWIWTKKQNRRMVQS